MGCKINHGIYQWLTIWAKQNQAGKNDSNNNNNDNNDNNDNESMKWC